MTILQRIQREPAKLLAFVVAILALLVGKSVISPDVSAWVLGIVAAAIGLLSYVVTPSKEVVAQELPGGQLIAGRAAITATGDGLAAVGLTPADGQAIVSGDTRGQYRARPVKRQP